MDRQTDIHTLLCRYTNYAITQCAYVCVCPRCLLYIRAYPSRPAAPESHILNSLFYCIGTLTFLEYTSRARE